MAVWVVRAGREGELEPVALEHGIAVIGWDELPDLSAIQSREELRDLCQEIFPELAPSAITQTVTQIWAFRAEIREGDLLLLPRKRSPDVVAIGRVIGPYRYRADLEAGAYHTHAVDWLSASVPRAAFGSDLHASINVPSTVSRVGAANAEERIDAILDGQPDPGPGDGATALQLDRQSEEYARSVLTKLYPEPDVRRAVLETLTASIKHAHQAGPRAWELTLRPTSFTFNVGMVWMMSGKVDTLSLLTDGRWLEPEAREGVAALGTIEVDQGTRLLKQPESVRFQGETLARFRHAPFYPALEKAHFCAIEEARARHSVAPFARAHSPGLLAYLRRELDEDLPDPEYARDPATPPPRHVWLFQANPAKYDLAAELKDTRPGDEGEWYVSRYGDEMRTGDAVLLWQSGENAGLFALGEVTGAPFRRPVYEWRSAESRGVEFDLAIPFRYTHVLDRPIPRSTFLEHPTLAGMQVIRVPQGTNFKVTQEEWRAIQALMRATPAPSSDRYVEPAFESIVQGVQSRGLRIDEGTLRRYHVALKVRGFVILTGISGTGKTWLASAYARAVRAQCLVVAVAPNWTTNEDLLGYWNPLDRTYHDTEFSRYLRDAADEHAQALLENRRPRPYHVILDEMNLARVEYYFARFLSAMEERSREGVARIELARDDSVLLPPNLYFVGTVNVDETTQSFADKVYDRAQLIELSVTREALWVHIGDEPYRDLLLQIWDAVHEVAPFAFRIVDEIKRYVVEAQSVGGTWKDGFDEQILQKVLPKLTRTDARVGETLRRIADIARENELSLTLEKASTMEAGFQQYGFASYF